MSKQDIKRLEQKEKERTEKHSKPQEENKEKASKIDVLKKWKGKDWFAILSPKSFGETFISETPATDSKYIAGRVIEVPVSHILNDKTKNHMKLIFKVTDVENKKAHTRFGGFYVVREFIGRNVRRDLEKLYVVDYAETKDKWKLQITTTAILNGKCESTILSKSRKLISDFYKQQAANSTLDDFVKNVMSSNYQKTIRKDCSKVYPVRFAEINRIEVITPGN